MQGTVISLSLQSLKNETLEKLKKKKKRRDKHICPLSANTGPPSPPTPLIDLEFLPSNPYEEAVHLFQNVGRQESGEICRSW